MKVDEERTRKQIRNILLLFTLIVLFAVCKLTSSFSINVVVSIFIFFMCVPIVGALEKAKFPSFIATFLTCCVVVVLISLGVYFVSYSINTLVDVLPFYAKRFEELDSFLVSILSRWTDTSEISSVIDIFEIDWINQIIVPGLRKVSTSALNLISNALITLLMALFILLERKTIIPKLVMATNHDDNGKVQIIFERISKQISKYLGLKILISAITGVLFWLVCYLLKMDLAVIIGVLAFILNFIPNIGSILVTLLTIILSILIFFPNWIPVIIVAVATILIQNLLGNIIEPRIQGTQLNLSPFIIMVCLSLFSYIWGIVGMFIAVPMMSILEIVFANIEETRGIAIMLSTGPVTKKGKKGKQQGENTSFIDEIILPEKEK